MGPIEQVQGSRMSVPLGKTSAGPQKTEALRGKSSKSCVPPFLFPTTAPIPKLEWPEHERGANRTQIEGEVWVEEELSGLERDLWHPGLLAVLCNIFLPD